MKTRSFKQLVALFLLLAFALGGTTAMAAGKLEIVNDSAYALLSSDDVYGYLYAQINNTGDKPVEYSDGLFELYDADGEVLASETYLKCSPRVLQPGESGYLSASYVRATGASSTADVADYSVSVTGKGKGYYVVRRYPATVRVETVTDKYSTEVTMYVTITNDTDALVYDMNVAAALLNSEGKVVYVETDSTYNVAIPAGGSVEMSLDVSRNVLDYFEEIGFTAENVQCIAYTEEIEW